MTPDARRHLLACKVDPEDVTLLGSNAVRRTVAIESARRFAAHASARILVLGGAPGCGKTIGAASWLLSAKRHTVDSSGAELTTWDSSARLVKASSLGLLNPKFNERDRAELEALKSLRWLVLDDLGTEPDEAIGLVRALIDHRYGHPVRTVITTMLAVQPNPRDPAGSRSRFEARYGAATIGRIAHRGWLQPCGTQNLRSHHPTPEVQS